MSEGKPATERPKRERPTITELNLLLEKLHNEKDPERAQELQEQIDKMRHEIAEAHDT